MSELATNIETKNASIIISRAILRIGSVSPASSSLLLTLNRVETSSGTLAVGLDNKLKCTLLYNKYFVNLLDEISPHLVENALLHELGHIIYFHLLSGKERLKGYDKFIDNVAKDLLINAHVVHLVSLKKNKYIQAKAIVPLPCTKCSKATSIEEYIEEARAMLKLNSNYVRIYGNDTKYDALILTLKNAFEDIIKANTGCSVCTTGNMLVSSPSIEGNGVILHLLAEILKETTEGDVEAKIFKLKEVCSILFPDKSKTESESESESDPNMDPFPAILNETEKATMQKVFKPFDTRELSTLKTMDELDEEQAAELKSRLSSSISNIAGNTSMYGVSSLAALLKDNTVKWEKYLRQSICTKISQLVSSSRLRRNRRFGFDQPGYIKEEVVNVVVAIDSSGSMPSELLERIKSNILTLKGNVKIAATVLEFDTEVVAEYPIEKLDSIRYSYGGTDLKAPIKWCLDNNIEKGTLVFVFTDGFGDATMPLGVYPNLKKYSYIWMLTKGGHDRYIVDGFKAPNSKIVRIDV